MHLVAGAYNFSSPTNSNRVLQSCVYIHLYVYVSVGVVPFVEMFDGCEFRKCQGNDTCLLKEFGGPF